MKEFVTKVVPLSRIAIFTKDSFKERFNICPTSLGYTAEPFNKPGQAGLDGVTDVYKVLEGQKDAWTIETYMLEKNIFQAVVDNGSVVLEPGQQQKTFARYNHRTVFGTMQKMKNLKTFDEVEKEVAVYRSQSPAMAMAMGSRPSLVTAADDADSDGERNNVHTAAKKTKLNSGRAAQQLSTVDLGELELVHAGILCQLAKWAQLPMAVVQKHVREVTKATTALRNEGRFSDVARLDNMVKDMSCVKSLVPCVIKYLANPQQPNKKVRPSFIINMDLCQTRGQIFIEGYSTTLAKHHIEAKIRTCAEGTNIIDAISRLDLVYLEVASGSDPLLMHNTVVDLVELILNFSMETSSAQLNKGKILGDVISFLSEVCVAISARGLPEEVDRILTCINSLLVKDATGPPIGRDYDDVMSSKHLQIFRVLFAHGNLSERLMQFIGENNRAMLSSAKANEVGRMALAFCLASTEQLEAILLHEHCFWFLPFSCCSC
jgi:hypothetical protein